MIISAVTAAPLRSMEIPADQAASFTGSISMAPSLSAFELFIPALLHTQRTLLAKVAALKAGRLRRVAQRRMPASGGRMAAAAP